MTATLLSIAAAIRWARRRPRTVSWSALLPWAPALWLWLFNAAAFAASINVSNFRYMIFSHVMILVLIWRQVAWSRIPVSPRRERSQ